MLEARTISVSIARHWRDLYEAIWTPEAFPRWASGLSRSGLRCDGDVWLADGPYGPIRIWFTPHNGFGIMDHHVDTGTGRKIDVPLRVVANGKGAEVLLTLFRQPGMSDQSFARDAEWIARDLAALRNMVDRETAERETADSAIATGNSAAGR